MKLWFRHHTEQLCSWMIVRKELVRACCSLGHEVHDDNDAPKFPWEWIEIWWGAPQDWSWGTKDVALRIGISLSESDQLLKVAQERALENLNRCDFLLTPCHSAKEAFLQMPIDMPMGLWPFGVDTERFRWSDRDFGNGAFSFLHAGVTQFRKGSWLVPEAFVRAFDEADNVKLTVASYAESEMWTSLKNEYDGDERIVFTSKAYKNPVRHYDGHHVLVAPHLSEGWGLCIPEAMALGMPCIVSRCSAPRDYFKPGFGWWVEMSDHYAPVSGCLVGTPGFWRLPNVNDLADKMRYAYQHRGECAAKGKEASLYVQENLTWEIGAASALNVIERFVNDGLDDVSPQPETSLEPFL